MAITKFADRCQQPSTTTGTGNITMTSALTGYFALSTGYATNEEIPYCVEGLDAAGNLTGEVEVGRGHLNGGGLLVRDAVFRSSNANALVNFSSPSLRVMVVASATALNELIAAQAGITTAAPIDLVVGAANAAGASSNLAKADHSHGLPAPAAPANVTKAAASAGASTNVARADHKHDIATAAPGTIAVGDAAAEGASTSVARADHTHALTAPAAPADVTKAAASAGASSNVARADHKHDVSTGVPTTATIGDTATEGSATSLARSDHKHALPAPAAPANVTKAAASAGASTNVARADHKHDITTAAPSIGIGAGSSEGVATTVARSDHNHAIRTGATDLTVGTINDGETLVRSGTTIASTPALALTAAAPVNVTKAAAAVGVATAAARADHKHDITTAVVGAIAVGDAAAEGAATSVARSDHVHSLAAPAAPANVTKASASAGVATTVARADHKHDVTTAAAVSLSVGGANAEGAATSLARSDHTHALAAPAAPVNVTKAAASAGTAAEAARADHKHDITTAVVGTIAVGDVAAEGVATSVARSDHTHALTAPAAPVAVTKAAAAAGVAATVARSDHKHDVSTAAPSIGIGAGSSEGVATTLARSDHNHAIRTGATDLTVGTINDGETLVRSGTTIASTPALALTASAPANVTKAAAAVGVATAAARADHKHDVTTAVVGAIAVGDAAAEGVATSLARSDHVHSFAAPAAPADITKAAASAGVATTVARSDHKHDVTTAAPTAGIGGANAEGSATTLARSDHNHALRTGVTDLAIGTVVDGEVLKRSGASIVSVAINPTAATPAALGPATAAAVGVSTDFARADHVHAVAGGTPSSLAPGSSNTQGSASTVARSDHTHALPAFGVADPEEVTDTPAVGVASTFARSDHVHDISFTTIKDTLANADDNINFGGVRLENVQNANSLDDAINLGQFIGGGYKKAVKVLATANVTKSGSQTIDGVLVGDGDRVGLAGQTAPAENGIWEIGVSGSGVWTRATDFDNVLDLVYGAAFRVMSGTVNGGSFWTLTNDPNGITLNTTALVLVPIVVGAISPVNVSSATAVVGVSPFAARADHKHNIDTGTPVQLGAGGALSAGTSSNLAKADHNHTIATTTAVSLTPGGANAQGASSSLARADHTHALPAFGTGGTQFCVGNDARLSDDRTTGGVRTNTGIVIIDDTPPSNGEVLTAFGSISGGWAEIPDQTDKLRLPPGFQAGTLANTTSLLATSTRAVYMGRVPRYGITQIEIRYRITTAAGTITYCEVGIGKTAADLNVMNSAVPITAIDVDTGSALMNSIAVHGNLFTFSSALLVPGDHIWILLSAQAVTPPALRAGLADDIGVGFHRTAAVRLSTMSANQSFTLHTDPTPYVAADLKY